MKRGAFKIAVILVSIDCNASEAAGAAKVFDRRPDRMPSFFQQLSQNAIILAWGEHTMGRIIETQTRFVRRTATELQRRVAEKNAKAYYAHLAPTKKHELKKKKIRYLAIPTVPSKETSPKAKEILMIWDIAGDSLVGQNVYELHKTPPVGTLATYDDLQAEYVGKPASPRL